MAQQEFLQSSGSQVGEAAALPPLSTPRRLAPADPVLLERLAATGFLATEFGLHEQAESIFECLAGLKRGKPSPQIALAMVQARRGRLAEGIAALRGLIEQHPDCELARAILGSMLIHIDDNEGRALLADVIARGADVDAVNVAISCLEQSQAHEPPAPPAAASVEFFRHYNVRP